MEEKRRRAPRKLLQKLQFFISCKRSRQYEAGISPSPFVCFLGKILLNSMKYKTPGDSNDLSHFINANEIPIYTEEIPLYFFEKKTYWL